MKELLKRSSGFTRIEFWALTTIFAFAIFFHIQDMVRWDHKEFVYVPYKHFFDQVNMPFRFYKNYFFPQLINHIVQYLFILLLNFILIPKLLVRKNLLRNVLSLIVAFVIAGTIFSITATYLKGYLYAGNRGIDSVDLEIFQDGFENAVMTIVLLIMYTVIKYAGIYLLTISATIEAKYKFIRKEAIVAAAIWLIGILVLRFGRAEREILVGWTVVIPCAIVLYLYSFYRLIPGALNRRKFQFTSYILNCAFILMFAFIAIYIPSIFILHDDDAGAGISAFNSFFQLFVTVPVTWMLYKRNLRGNEEINVLQTELKQSSASVHFLRSQINPHFLFNALNTLYGTAIQENAERTSEGIQKLGDMMRFMLQENIHEKISLAREIDYLNNYISLQKLRTDPNPNIDIDVHIEQQLNTIQIAPMLLIPFIENAFKHGISFREHSYIKVSLQFMNDTLYFDVANSRHIRPDNDPEKGKSGIGLENVKQRLQHVYAGKHELLIRETAKDFFVHLTLQLV